MATNIQWTDETWNPVTGCTKVSQGCKNCYAERDFPRAYAKTGRKFTDIMGHADRRGEGHGDDRMLRLYLRDRKGGDMSEWPDDLRVREWPR